MAARPVRKPRRWGRRLGIAAGVLLALVLVAWFAFTSPAPLFSQPPAPTAAEVGAGRAAYWQLRDSRGRAGKVVSFTPAHLAGLGAVASDGFAPDRLRVRTRGRSIVAEASHQLPLGRWLNVTATAEAPSKTFPDTRIKVGAVSFPPWLSRAGIEVVRLLLLARGTDVPPLEWAVRDFAIKEGTVSARLQLPGKMGLVDQLAGVVSTGDVNEADVVRTYCALADSQRKRKSEDFAEQVRRAFAVDPGGDAAAANKASFIALAMLLVDERAGDFAGEARAASKDCRVPAPAASLHGRQDSAKHWAVSAALAVGAGVQLSEAVGEWKELADSLEARSEFAAGDPTGFSMSDVAADRAGFLTATAAARRGQAAPMRRALARVTAEELLPGALLAEKDGMRNAEFVQRYGGIDDPRYKARVREIDAVLERSPLR